jgi:lantibiotic modifying enzyme
VSSSPEPQRTWRPLLAGEEKALAVESAVAIARDLADPSAGLGAAVPARVRSFRASAASGLAGEALFHAHLERCRPGEGFGERGMECIEKAIATISSAETVPDLYNGFTGVAWAVELLRESLLDVADDEDPNHEIDDALRRLLGHSPWRRHYDLTNGLVGFAVYALRRLPRPAAVECLELLVDRLAEVAVERPEGLSWFTSADELAGETRDFFSEGNENLGVAHGVPGVIAVLARIEAAGVAAAKAGALLRGAVGWLLAQKMTGRDSIFPTAVAPNVEVKYSRAAWCYGDPGVAATLLVAARAAADASWESEALAFAHHSARRPEDTMGVRDACLCHGAAGLAHLFNRMYQATGDDALRQAALHWYRHVLEQRRPGVGVGGFLGWGAAGAGELAWNPDPTLLTGAVGIGLALLAGACPDEPCWDELLLVSPIAPPPARQR